jgi:hypothetical protein
MVVTPWAARFPRDAEAGLLHRNFVSACAFYR